MSKILILTASPIRDAIVDELLSEELAKRGHEVSIRPCLREGRAAVIEVMPDVVVVPPIRNPYSRDFTDTLKHWGLGVVSRHTEPSCDKADFEKMEPWQRMDIFGKYPYNIDAELVWSEQEAEILGRRKVSFDVTAVGAFTVDAHLRADVIDRYRNKDEFCKKYGLDPEKKTLLICSPWGFADAAPDLHVDDLDFANKDMAGRDRHFHMIKTVSAKFKDQWNIIVSTHPGVVQQPYKDLCKQLGLPLDTESTSFYLKVNVDAIVHAGSTMAIGAHFLGIPAYQFGDIYCKDANNWWMDPESPISKISPFFAKAEDLCREIEQYQPGTNANAESLKNLEQGRFGIMDGHATERAAEIIDKVQGKFKFKWPKGSIYDYSQLTILRNIKIAHTSVVCNICGESFAIINESYLERLAQHVLQTISSHVKGTIPDEVMQKMWTVTRQPNCPWCGARWVQKDE
ncbi:MAG TPA: hypothetical protein HPP87_07175 [Planctomycetes bacterium]|nr:hypothetical protein [Planctomycetota bacterium]